MLDLLETLYFNAASDSMHFTNRAPNLYSAKQALPRQFFGGISHTDVRNFFHSSQSSSVFLFLLRIRNFEATFRN